MMIELNFEELPILSDGKAIAGLLEGTAEISGQAWSWSIDEIYLNAYGVKGIDKLKVDRRSSLWPIIANAIEDHFAKQVEREFDAADEAAREQAAELRAEMKREDRMMGWV